MAMNDFSEAPTPLHLLRSHSSPVAALYISDDNERIYSADQSGKVVVTSTRSLRPITTWNPHKDGILTISEWDQYIVTHGRDDKLHVWKRVDELPISARVGASARAPTSETPALAYSMDVNSLNFCRFSLLRLSNEQGSEPRALLALPNLVDSSTVDIWSLPDRRRVHATIGQGVVKSIFSAEPGGRNTSGIIMALHIFYWNNPETTSTSPGLLSLVCSYENGSVVLRRYTNTEKEMSVEGRGWETIWSSKLHQDSIMAMAVSPSNTFALTVSADHIIGWFNLEAADSSSSDNFIAHRTKHPGNASVAIRPDGKVCAVGGWDGKIRLYSTKSFKPLGTLRYHKANVQSLTFAKSLDSNTSSGVPEEGAREPDSDDETEGEEDEMSPEEKESRSRWLVAGSKDNRVSIWQLISFSKSSLSSV